MSLKRGLNFEKGVRSNHSNPPKYRPARISSLTSLRFLYIILFLIISNKSFDFQDDKDLVHQFANSDGLACLIKVGAEADQNYQN